jgi:hypothetical protein
VVLAVWTSATHLLKDVFFIRMHPLKPTDHMLSQHLLVDVSTDTFTSRSQLNGCLNP